MVNLWMEITRITKNLIVARSYDYVSTNFMLDSIEVEVYAATIIIRYI